MYKILLEVLRVEESHPNMLGRVPNRSVPREGVDVNQKALNIFCVCNCFLIMSFVKLVNVRITKN